MAIALAGVLTTACGHDGASTSTTRSTETAPTTTIEERTAGAADADTDASADRQPLMLVALGDSDSTGHGDPTGQGWVTRYAALLRQSTGRDVAVMQRARDGLTSAQLLAALNTDNGLRDAIANADIIVIGEGGADLNPGDDAFAAGRCSGQACYESDLARFGHNISAQIDVIAELRDARPAVLRAITLPNGLTGAEDVIPPFLAPIATELGVHQAAALRQSTCDAVEAHNGRCVDVLTAFNGPDGTTDAYARGLMNHEDCCYPSGDGHQLVAQLLLATGTNPVPLTGGPPPATTTA